MPRACPDCGNLDIAPIGRGTERLEEQLAGAAARGARIARIDADSTRSKGALEAQLGAVHAGEVDVLVGTQMVAKGHDFRRITLVAAVNPDSSLFSSDFRAPERLFALLMQAAGRAGRDAAQASPSEMWVQTWHPAASALRRARRHDFAAFAASQLKERASAGLPPYSHLAVLRAEAKTAEAARGFLAAAAEVAPAAGGGRGGDGLRAGAARHRPRRRRRADADAGRVGRRARRCRRCCAPGCRCSRPCARSATRRSSGCCAGRWTSTR